MVANKFTSLVGSVTLALIVANSLNAAPVLVRRDDGAAAPASYISVAQPQMNEQDIYAVGIPDAPAAPIPMDTFAQVIQAAAEAALAKSNQTIAAINSYDPTPAPATAEQSKLSPATNAVASADTVLTGNPDQAKAFQQAIGSVAGAATAAENDAAMTGNPDQGDEYKQVIAQQMDLLGQKARRALASGWDEALLAARQIPPPLASAGAPSSVTPVTSVTSADVPVAPPVPSDFASPPAPSPSSNLAAPGAPAAPGVSAPAVSGAPAVSAAPTSGLPTSGLPASAPAAPALPTGASSLPETPAVPSVSAPAADPSLPVTAPSAPAAPGLGGLKDSEAGAVTMNPSDPSPTSGDMTMTVTLPSTATPTSLGDLANIKAKANANADEISDWKTMTILVPAQAFGGPQTQVNIPISTSAAASASASASSSASDAKATLTASASSATPTMAPINLSSFSALKPQATNVLTIPLTGVIDGTTYSTMLTLTIPGLATETTSIAATNTASATEKAPATATASPSATVAPSKTSSSSSAKATSSVDPSYIHPDDIPPLLKSSMLATPTSAPAPTGTALPDTTDDEDCEEVDDSQDSPAAPKSLMSQVWDWVTGKPLNERDFEDDYYSDDYDYDVDADFYDAQESQE